MGWGGGSPEQFIQQMHIEHSLCTRWAPAICHTCADAVVWVEEATALPLEEGMWPYQNVPGPRALGAGGGSEAGGGGWPGLWIPMVVAALQGKCAMPPGCHSAWGRGLSLFAASLFACLKSAVK